MIISLFSQGFSIQQIIYYLIIFLFALTLSFSVHEFMHAATAVWLGDPTPRNMGRLTLNPIAHVDPVGTILLLLAGFGWGKPVMYNPRNLHRFKSQRGMNIMVHLAGVTGNFAVGIVASILAILFGSLAVKFSGTGGEVVLKALYEAFEYTYQFSMMLLAFNLLPIPPLDGSKILYSVLSDRSYMKLMFYERYGMILMLVLVSTGILGTPLSYVTESVFDLLFPVAQTTADWTAALLWG